MYAACSTLATDAETALAIEALIPGEIDGLLAHVAGPVTDGWRIVDVWESEEKYQRFAAEVLAPAVRQVVGDRKLAVAPQTLAVHGQTFRRGNEVLAPAGL